MQMESWQELANPRDLTKIFQTPEHAAWKSLRESEDARYLGLTMPRFLARLPYGAKTDPVEEFDFEEDTAGAQHDKYTWANSAYAMAANINRSFKMYGWCSRIRGVESGGSVEGLPTHTFPTDDGGVDMKCPTEIAISDRREAELAKNGFMPLIHKKIQTSPPSSALSPCKSRSSMTIRTPPPTPISRPGFPICSQPAASRTI
jgi:type VI secretion system protein ImpC